MALNFPSSPTLGQVYTDTTSGFSYEWTGVVWKSFTAANASTIKSLDDISASFNGSTQTFALTSSGIAVYPINDAQLIVNLGGVVQDPVNDYNVSGSNITFTTAPTSGLTFSATLLGVGVPIDYANSGNVYERQVYTATAGQTTFTFTAGYTPGYLDVYRNGVRLASGSDFTATSGTSFVLTTPALLNDEVEAIGYKVKTIVTSQGDVVNLNVTGIATISPSTFINNTGINVAGIVTATTFSGNATGLTGSPNITVGNITSGNINSSGVVTATSFKGDGSQLSGVGLELKTAGVSAGTGITSINFSGAVVSAASAGISTVTISGISSTGISTAAIWSNPSVILTSIGLTHGNNNYGAFGPITVSVGATVTVGVANTWVIV